MESFWLGILTCALSEKSSIDWLILQLMKMPFWPLKRVSKHTKMVKANNFPHTYPKIGVSRLHNAALPDLPWWKKTKIHRFYKKQSEWNTQVQKSSSRRVCRIVFLSVRLSVRLSVCQNLTKLINIHIKMFLWLLLDSSSVAWDWMFSGKSQWVFAGVWEKALQTYGWTNWPTDTPRVW